MMSYPGREDLGGRSAGVGTHRHPRPGLNAPNQKGLVVSLRPARLSLGPFRWSEQELVFNV